VAVTRAREELYITRAQSRMLYGQTNRNAPSRFLQDIPGELTEEINRCRAATDFGGGWGGSRYGSGGYSDSYGGSRQDRSSAGGYTYTARESSSATDAFHPQRKAPVGSQVTVGRTPAHAPATSVKWQVGDRVSSPVFGEGQITATTPMSGDTLLVIQFDKVGQKKLMANFAKLNKA
jgi:DNA helicase-2/ATP-dependent DNA helicase PcrA